MPRPRRLTLDALIADPIVRALMRSDGVTPRALIAVWRAAAHAPAAHAPAVPARPRHRIGTATGDRRCLDAPPAPRGRP